MRWGAALVVVPLAAACQDANLLGRPCQLSVVGEVETLPFDAPLSELAPWAAGNAPVRFDHDGEPVTVFVGLGWSALDGPYDAVPAHADEYALGTCGSPDRIVARVPMSIASDGLFRSVSCDAVVDVHLTAEGPRPGLMARCDLEDGYGLVEAIDGPRRLSVRLGPQGGEAVEYGRVVLRGGAAVTSSTAFELTWGSGVDDVPPFPATIHGL